MNSGCAAALDRLQDFCFMAIKVANREPCTPPRSTLILTPAFVVYTELGIDPSRKLLTARRSSLSDEDESAVDVMLNFSEKLYQAYALKELFFNFMDAKNRSEAAELLSIWFNACDWLMLPEFMACRRLLKNWKPYILNAFDALSPTASPMAATTPLKPSNAWPLVSVISATSAPAFYAL